MPTTKAEAARARKALDGLKTQLKKLDIDVDIMDVNAVLDAVELSDEQAESYQAAVKAVKAFDVAQSEDGMSLTINYVPDEEKMEEGEEEEPVDDGEKSLALKAANRRIKNLEEKQRKLNKLLDENGGKVKTMLPGEAAWKAKKSRSRTVFSSPEVAHTMGLSLLASDYVRKHAPDRHAEAVKSLDKMGIKAQATFPNSKGGAAVFDQISAELINEVIEYGVMRREANNVQMTSDRLPVARNKGGLVGYYPDEGGSLTESDLALDNVYLTARKLIVYNKQSHEILQDSAINFAELVSSEMMREVARSEDAAGFNGDGTSTYGGINGIIPVFGTTAATTYRSVSGGDNSAAHTLANLRALKGKLPTRYQNSAKWYCTTPVKGEVFDRLAGDVGGYGAADIAGRPAFTFLGHPIEIVEVMNTDTDTGGDVVDILFGDLSRGVRFGDREAPSIDISTDALFANDQVAMRSRSRYDINFHEQGDGTNAGAVVALFQT